MLDGRSSGCDRHPEVYPQTKRPGTCTCVHHFTLSAGCIPDKVLRSCRGGWMLGGRRRRSGARWASRGGCCSPSVSGPIRSPSLPWGLNAHLCKLLISRDFLLAGMELMACSWSEMRWEPEECVLEMREREGGSGSRSVPSEEALLWKCRFDSQVYLEGGERVGDVCGA